VAGDSIIAIGVREIDRAPIARTAMMARWLAGSKARWFMAFRTMPIPRNEKQQRMRSCPPLIDNAPATVTQSDRRCVAQLPRVSQLDMASTRMLEPRASRPPALHKPTLPQPHTPHSPCDSLQHLLTTTARSLVCALLPRSTAPASRLAHPQSQPVKARREQGAEGSATLVSCWLNLGES